MKVTITLYDSDRVAAFTALKNLEPWVTSPDRKLGEGYNLYVLENSAGRTRYVGRVKFEGI